jgi:hypothetical protein
MGRSSPITRAKYARIKLATKRSGRKDAAPRFIPRSHDKRFDPCRINPNLSSANEADRCDYFRWWEERPESISIGRGGIRETGLLIDCDNERKPNRHSLTSGANRSGYLTQGLTKNARRSTYQSPNTRHDCCSCSKDTSLRHKSRTLRSVIRCVRLNGRRCQSGKSLGHMQYRRAMLDRTWHFCRTCSHWPRDSFNIVRLATFPTNFTLCQECLDLQQSCACSSEDQSNPASCNRKSVKAA